MKTISSFLLVLLFLSCSRSNDDTNTIQVQTQTVTSGTWRVTLFTDSGNNETSDFSRYSFQFAPGAVLTASKPGSSNTGNWSLASSSNKLNIDLGAKTDSNKPLGELTDDWKIISITSTEIKLSDDNTSSHEFLTFTKN